MMRVTSEEPPTAELILPDGRVIRLAGGRPVVELTGAAVRPDPADRRRRRRPAVDPLRGRAIDISA